MALAAAVPVSNERIEKLQISCPVCGSNNYTVTYTPKVEILDPPSLYGAASGVRGTQTLVTCNDCALLYENPRYSEDVILSGYRAAKEHGHDSQHELRMASFFSALKSLSSHLPPPGSTVLDIGTAGGAFLDAAGKFGYEAYGLEPSQYLVAQGQKRGLKIFEGTTSENNMKGQKFDMVCLWDVLEHVVDPVQVLKDIRQFLKPGGTLLINYPDIGTWQAKLAGERFWWLLSVHLTHFSPKTLKKLAQVTGYQPILFKPYWQTLELGYLGKMAAHLGIPLASFTLKLMPDWLKRIKVPYYASQTTTLFKVQ